MNDQALLEIKPEDLTPEANQILEEELEKRGLLQDAPPKAAEDPDGPAEDLPASGDATHPAEALVELTTFTSMSDARLAVSLLRSAEIPCGLDQSPYSPEMKLMVPASMVEQANEVLNSEVSEEELAAQAEAAAPEEDPEPKEE
jgi:hypothetical protein